MNALPTTEGGFKVVLADPPWQFNTLWGGRPKKVNGSYPSRAIEAHYDTMSLTDLKALPVESVCAKDCALIMWVLDALLPEALELGAAWGFTYKNFGPVWHKGREGYSPHPGLGYWFRKQSETSLMFTRGSPKRLSAGVEQIIYCKRGVHSAKPDEQYDRIEAMLAGPYLELFARSRRPGWAAWGNEVGVRDGALFEGAA